VLELFREARKGPFTVMAYEFFTDRCFARVAKHRKVRLPLGAPSSHYVLLEIEQASEAELDPWMASLFERELITDGTMAQNSSQASELWTLREGISESLSATGLPHKNDIALPITELDTFCRELENVFAGRYAGWEVCVFGHIGDGNLHVNVMKPDTLDPVAFRAKTKEADHDMFKLVKAHHGTISAEHGIGLLKKDYLGYSRSSAELEVLRAVKRALDPKNLLNPGKILDV
jgi:FAD/FMN-containing dehydrogenase